MQLPFSPTVPPGDDVTGILPVRHRGRRLETVVSLEQAVPLRRPTRLAEQYAKP
jgi:hypothetical protein